MPWGCFIPAVAWFCYGNQTKSDTDQQNSDGADREVWYTVRQLMCCESESDQLHQKELPVGDQPVGRLSIVQRQVVEDAF